MKIHLIKEKTIYDYVMSHKNASSAFFNWLNIIKMANWNDLNDILKTFNTADILGNGSDRVVFNIGGNNYRLICSYFFGINQVHMYINWIGTHAEYSKICDKYLQYTIEQF